MNPKSHGAEFLFTPLLLACIVGLGIWKQLETMTKLLSGTFMIGVTALIGLFMLERRSPWGRQRKKRQAALEAVPDSLLADAEDAIRLGFDLDLGIPIYLPDRYRSRHVHILGATGSGKTESVIINFLKQDVARGLGTIILDAKGDQSFLTLLKDIVEPKSLYIFDLSSPESLGYDPLQSGSAIEAAQRLFSSFVWSEEYYKSKALAALQRIFVAHFEINNCNPTLLEISHYMASPAAYAAFLNEPSAAKGALLKEFEELSGLRDQIRSLTLAHLGKILSPSKVNRIDIEAASSGAVIYFRLQSLISPQIVSILGKLIINNLSYLAGVSHRDPSGVKKAMIPVYLDEFASFACEEFADLISKARSAGFALHFAHQSIGDVLEVSPGFLNRITDNAATKIVMRINDPDSAEFFAKAFGTRLYQKATQRVTNAKQLEAAEVLEEGSIREAHQFRAPPDLLKTLPTGQGSVLIAHGEDMSAGASAVFRIKFPPILQLARDPTRTTTSNATA
ncbi:MAG: DUF87 domain-containing protein [Proteobacteria bacterium]|nr:MAG: DUF87 domain-containing protein [Pseudomonadota bacterium]